MNKYNVSLSISLIENLYEVEANSEKEAIKKAKEKSDYKGYIVRVFEVEKSK